MYILYIFAIFAMTYAIRELDGPFNILSRFRNFLMTKPPGKLKVFFYQLLSCSYCVGTYPGILVFLTTLLPAPFNLIILWGLTGASVSIIFTSVLERINRE